MLIKIWQYETDNFSSNAINEHDLNEVIKKMLLKCFLILINPDILSVISVSTIVFIAVRCYGNISSYKTLNINTENEKYFCYFVYYLFIYIDNPKQPFVVPNFDNNTLLFV